MIIIINISDRLSGDNIHGDAHVWPAELVVEVFATSHNKNTEKSAKR